MSSQQIVLWNGLGWVRFMWEEAKHLLALWRYQGRQSVLTQTAEEIGESPGTLAGDGTARRFHLCYLFLGWPTCIATFSCFVICNRLKYPFLAKTTIPSWISLSDIAKSTPLATPSTGKNELWAYSWQSHMSKINRQTDMPQRQPTEVG